MPRKIGYICLSLWVVMLILTQSFAKDLATEAGTLMKTMGGIKATLKVSPNMMDLYLVDEKTGKAIKEAKVVAVIVTPKGDKAVKELMGMEMPEGFSFMSGLDARPKGSYIFSIRVETGKKKTSFDFTYEAK